MNPKTKTKNLKRSLGKNGKPTTESGSLGATNAPRGIVTKTATKANANLGKTAAKVATAPVIKTARVATTSANPGKTATKVVRAESANLGKAVVKAVAKSANLGKTEVKAVAESANRGKTATKAVAESANLGKTAVKAVAESANRGKTATKVVVESANRGKTEVKAAGAVTNASPMATANLLTKAAALAKNPSVKKTIFS